jgi:purine-binding chemotaxis protein CheW
MVVGALQEKQTKLVLFTLDEQRYALDLASVERIVRVVDVTPLPKAPPIVLGIINVKGDVVPVYDLRGRFRLPGREISLSDQLMIAKTSRQTVALLVDGVDSVLEVADEEIASAQEILPEIEYVHGVVKLQDGLVLIHDLDQFLSPEEERTLEGALNSVSSASDSAMRND